MRTSDQSELIRTPHGSLSSPLFIFPTDDPISSDFFPSLGYGCIYSHSTPSYPYHYSCVIPHLPHSPRLPHLPCFTFAHEPRTAFRPCSSFTPTHFTLDVECPRAIPETNDHARTAPPVHIPAASNPPSRPSPFGSAASSPPHHPFLLCVSNQGPTSPTGAAHRRGVRVFPFFLSNLNLFLCSSTSTSIFIYDCLPAYLFLIPRLDAAPHTPVPSKHQHK